MPNFLYLTDPSLPCNLVDPEFSRGVEGDALDTQRHGPGPDDSRGKNTCQAGLESGDDLNRHAQSLSSTELFPCRKGKMDSFSLHNSLALVSKFCGSKTLWETSANKGIKDQGICTIKTSGTLVSKALITSHRLPFNRKSKNDVEKITNFQFNGLELTSNATKLEITYTTSGCGNKECIALCIGVPLSDTLPIDSVPTDVDGTLGVGTNLMDTETGYYKFNYCIPEAPVSTEKISLQFQIPFSGSCNNVSTIVVQKLDVFGQIISDSFSELSSNDTNHSQQQKDMAKCNGGFNSNHVDAEQNSLSSHLRNEMATLHHLDPRHLHIRDQADIISRIPGVNLFIRPFEEVTTTAMERMMSEMEYKILESVDCVISRLDKMESRLDMIEKCLDVTKNDVRHQQGPSQKTSNGI